MHIIICITDTLSTYRQPYRPRPTTCQIEILKRTFLLRGLSCIIVIRIIESLVR